MTKDHIVALNTVVNRARFTGMPDSEDSLTYTTDLTLKEYDLLVELRNELLGRIDEVPAGEGRDGNKD